MEKQEFSLGEYLAGGIERIVKRAVRATLTNPRESAFMAQFALSSREAARKRAEAEGIGENIPPFLIASITSSCNLHCAGCYARHKAYCDSCGKNVVPDSVLLSVQNGEFAEVMSSSGSSKSTLLTIAGMLLAPDSGKISIAGKNVSDTNKKQWTQIRREHIGFIFQNYHLLFI